MSTFDISTQKITRSLAMYAASSLETKIYGDSLMEQYHQDGISSVTEYDLVHLDTQFSEASVLREDYLQTKKDYIATRGEQAFTKDMQKRESESNKNYSSAQTTLSVLGNEYDQYQLERRNLSSSRHNDYEQF